jgi:hypothetical protein
MAEEKVPDATDKKVCMTTATTEKQNAIITAAFGPEITTTLKKIKKLSKGMKELRRDLDGIHTKCLDPSSSRIAHNDTLKKQKKSKKRRWICCCCKYTCLITLTVIFAWIIFVMWLTLRTNITDTEKIKFGRQPQ